MKLFNRYITGLVLALFLIVLVPGLALAFSDTRQHWAQMEIEHLQSREILSGYPDGSYRPQAYINRQEFVVLLIRAMNRQHEAQVLQKGESFFNDTAGTWSQGYVELAREMDIAHGDGQGNFAPLRSINREEAVAMLVKCLDSEASEVGERDFNDASEISSWARPAVTLAVQQGLVHGFPDNTFRPRNNLTRAEVAILLESLLTCQGQEYQIYGTITKIELPLHRATIRIGDSEENFELVSNLVVWDKEKRQALSDLILPATAYFDLNSSGKLAFILTTSEFEGSRVKFNLGRLPVVASSPSGSSSLVTLSESEKNDEVLPVDAKQAAASLEATCQAMWVKEFSSKTGATGKGQLVAVIDSGMDPGHPDLQITASGFRKMLDFIDLTDEGKVALIPVRATAGYLKLGEEKVEVAGLVNGSDIFKYGYLKLDFLPSESGLAARQVLVLLTASQPGGKLDMVYLDSNGNGEIEDETPLEIYSAKQQIANIKGDKGCSFNLVVSEISDRENYVKLGFDCYGHGTEMAGIVAAHGQVEGVAPDAQLLVIKIMNRLGQASLQQLESALSLAADRGAGVAVISLGQYNMTKAERESLTNTAAMIWKSRGMIICMAAGNSGPGLGTVADSTAIRNIISVGAYATPQMWATDYGWQVPRPTLWYFTSTGPAVDGSASPLVLAPGSAISTYPLWAGSGYRLDEGTSISAPHLAGAAALLLDANMHRLYNNDSWAVYQALLAGARPIKGLQPVEQGFGVVDLMRSWVELQLRKGETAPLEAEQYSPGVGLAQGLYTRGETPASLSLHISNEGDIASRVSLGGFASWIKPEQFILQVPAHSERSVNINYDSLNEPGLYSNFLVADDFNSSGLDLALLQTIVVPWDLEKMKEKTFEQQETLEPGSMKRYFFRVPDGASGINFRLMIKDGQGRARIHAISPRGNQETSAYAGAGDEVNVQSTNLAYSNPEPGIWEVVVYSSVTLSDYGLKESAYTLQASMEGQGRNVSLPPDKRYLVTTVVPQYTRGEKTDITLYFWNPVSKQPASGLVSIEGRLYEIQGGMVKLSLIPQADSINLNLAW